LITQKEKLKRRKVQGTLKMLGISQKMLAKEMRVSEVLITYLFSGQRDSPEKYEELLHVIESLKNEKKICGEYLRKGREKKS